MARTLGRYELLRPLARGGMAEVFLARRRSGGVEKIVVIKRIHPERAGDPRFLELFLREARVSMGLTHQNIVPVFDFGRVGEQVFLAMERVEGADLGATLARATRPPPPLVAAFIAGECCGALAYAHRRAGADGAPLGIVHRDVTPRNVLLSWSGEVKLTDFGVAGLAGDDGGRTIGTPAYMAPEQARGEPIDARADVYAVGLLLRELLTGVRAREGDDRPTTIDAARRGALRGWPAEVAAGTARLRAIAERATAPAAADRFPTAAAMGEALDDASVAMRAELRGDAPARQLAAWMEEVWGSARDRAASERVEAAAIDGSDDGGDDHEGALGTGTARSLAETAEEEAAAAPAPVDAAPASAPAPGPAPAPAPVAAGAGRRRRARALALGGGLISIAVVALVLGAGRAAPRPAVSAAPLDAAPARSPIDAGPAPTPAPAPLDAAPARAPIDAGPAPAPLDAAPTPGRRSPPDQAALARRPAVDAGAALPAPALRRVRVNARPWALFTVDGLATVHETITTVELAPGPHRLHFRNPELGVERDVTIVVPADRDLDHVEDLRR